MDLNIIVQTDDQRDSDQVIIKKLQTAERLGIETVALSVKLTPTMKNTVIPDPVYIEVPSTSNMKILSRLTLCIDSNQDNLMYKVMQQPNVKEYDLLSFQPMGDKLMNQICSGSHLCDILTFDMSCRLPVDLRRANLNLLKQRGTCFEINYSDALKGQSARQQTLSNGQLLVDKSRGRNVILSSGATSSLHLRSPSDVSNLGYLFDMKGNQCKDSASKNGLLAIKHSKTRRNPNSACLVQVQENEAEPQDSRLIEMLKDKPKSKKQRVK